MSVYKFFYILSIITFAVSLICLILRITRSKKEDMVFNKQYFYLINIMGIFSSIFMCVFSYQREEIEPLLIFALMSSLALFSSIVWYNEVIIFKDEQFTVRNSLGIKKVYRYTDVDCFFVKTEKHRYGTETTAYFYTGKKKFSVLTSAYNYTDFFEKLNCEHKKHNNGKNLPKLKRKK